MAGDESFVRRKAGQGAEEVQRKGRKRKGAERLNAKTLMRPLHEGCKRKGTKHAKGAEVADMGQERILPINPLRSPRPLR